MKKKWNKSSHVKTGWQDRSTRVKKKKVLLQQGRLLFPKRWVRPLWLHFLVGHWWKSSKALKQKISTIVQRLGKFLLLACGPSLHIHVELIQNHLPTKNTYHLRPVIGRLRQLYAFPLASVIRAWHLYYKTLYLVSITQMTSETC